MEVQTENFHGSGDPFVLRDAEAPMQNLRTYAGISSDRLEQMETRLKEDILNEAKKCDGLILVHDELGELIVSKKNANSLSCDRQGNHCARVDLCR